MSDQMTSARDFLRHCFDEGVAAVQPARAFASVAMPDPRGVPWIVAIGKAAPGMADALAQRLSARGTPVCGGLVVAPAGSQVAAPPLLQAVGNHPIPGTDSKHAAQLLERIVTLIPPTAEVHVALSGGASALLGAPRGGISDRDLADVFTQLQRHGVPIDVMNGVRRRLLRWGNGRLAAALAPRPVSVWAISDVPGDDLATIGSGPCSEDPWRGRALQDALAQWIPRDTYAAEVPQAVSEEGPGADDPIFGAVTRSIIASNAVACRAAAHAAGACEVVQRVSTTTFEGESKHVGRALATEAMHAARDWQRQNQALEEDGHGDAIRPLLLVWGGESTVTLGDNAGRGGRAQELAVAAAEMLDISPLPITMLVAGTDGIDGSTDAAGAIVDHQSWQGLQAIGDPTRALVQHDAYPLLDQAGLLLRPGPTGTNVMDLVLAVVGWECRELRDG